MPMENGRAYGCVFCVTGKEQQVAEQIHHVCPDVRQLPFCRKSISPFAAEKAR